MENTYIVILIILIILINTSIMSPTSESFVGYYLGQPTKCFSCERQLPKHLKYMGGPTKCFSCERELAMRYGGEYADLGQPSKCFSCERQYR